jgi:biopolymer transport protein ExbB
MSLLNVLRAPLAAALVVIATLATTAPAPALAQASAPAADAAAPAAAPAPAPAEPVVAKEEVTTPTAWKALWKQGDFVAKGTLIIMIIMSMGSGTSSSPSCSSSEAAEERQRRGRRLLEGQLDEAGHQHPARRQRGFRYIAEPASRPDEHHEGTMVEAIDKHTWISMSVERAVGSIRAACRRPGLLATVGSTAPFVGLFGTVWGIYNALVNRHQRPGQIDKVAGPVGEALIMTAIGLAVAVPAVMGYNWLIRRNKTVMDRTAPSAATCTTSCSPASGEC